MNEQFSFRWGIDILDSGYTTIPNWIVDNYNEVNVSYKEFALIVHLARYAYESPEGECRPSVETVAKSMGIHARSVQRSLANLEERGLLTRHYRLGKPTIYDFAGFSKAIFRVAAQHMVQEEAARQETSTPDENTPPLENTPADDPKAAVSETQGGDKNVTPDENVTPDRNVTPDKNVRGGGDKNVTPGVTKMSPEEQKKEQQLRTTTTRSATPNADIELPTTQTPTNVVASFERDILKLPSALTDNLKALDFQGASNWRVLTETYQADPEYIQTWVEALVSKRVTARNPAAFLVTAIREHYPAPVLPPPEIEFNPPDLHCPVCQGTGVPLGENGWLYGEHCPCTFPEGYTPPPKKTTPKLQPDLTCPICQGTGIPLVDGQWQYGEKCSCLHPVEMENEVTPT